MIDNAEVGKLLIEHAKLRDDKLELKIVVYWIRGLAAESCKGVDNSPACWSIADQGLTNPGRRTMLLRDAPDWVKSQFPQFFDKAVVSENVPVPAVSSPEGSQAGATPAVSADQTQAEASAGPAVQPVRACDDAGVQAFSWNYPELRFDAAEAAFEMDNAIVGNGKDFKKSLLLKSMISKVLNCDNITITPNRSVDSLTLSVLWSAMSAATKDKPLIAHTGWLMFLLPWDARDREMLELFRDFFLNLSDTSWIGR